MTNSKIEVDIDYIDNIYMLMSKIDDNITRRCVELLHKENVRLRRKIQNIEDYSHVD